MQRRLIEGPPRSDLHIHTYSSPDSWSSPDEICRAALRHDLSAVAITDHAEAWETWDPASKVRFEGRRISDPDRYFHAINEVKSRYAGRLRVIAGVEIGYWSSREHDIRGFLSSHPFEFAIGSVHDSPPVSWRDPALREILRDHPELARKALTFYYSEVRAAAESGLFNTIAHIDIYERYSPRQWPDIFADEELAPVVRRAVQAVAQYARMEINLSTVHTSKEFPWSALQLLRMYREMGGKPPTVGTDSHVAKTVGRGLEEAERLAKQAGFESTADWHEVLREELR